MSLISESQSSSESAMTPTASTEQSSSSGLEFQIPKIKTEDRKYVFLFTVFY
jgi:hypothetical protein